MTDDSVTGSRHPMAVVLSDSEKPDNMTPVQSELYDKVLEEWKTPGSELAFGGVEKIRKHLQGSLTTKQIQSLLREIYGYTMHRQFRKVKYRQPFIVQ